jgi:flavin reductase (DIM6/NTAB) family NADH-FMN oxidoreductase RutF
MQGLPGSELRYSRIPFSLATMTPLDDSFHHYQPKTGHGLAHDPFNAIVGPRPIGWISTRSAAGAVNLAPYSFFNAFNYVPPIIGFASIGAKDTLRNIEETGEFVWNLVTRPLAEQMNQTCAPVGPGVNEFELAGLEAIASSQVAVPRVGLSPVAFECRKTQVLQLQGVDGCKVPTWLVLGEVVAVHIAKRLLKDGVYQTAEAQVVMRGGGPADYFQVGQEQLFRMGRPT